jgi:hypothetical protein
VAERGFRDHCGLRPMRSPEEPSADPRDALIAAQAERMAALETLITDLRERRSARGRGTGNTMAARQGASLRELMERMGHSSTRPR